MKRLFVFFSVVVFFSLLACHPTKKVVNENPVSTSQNDKNIIEVIFLHINDVYEIAPLEGGKVGGLARLKTVYDQLKKENPNVLFVHAGDFLNPSLIGTMKLNGERIKGKQMVEVLNAIGLDVVTFGNHEFDLKEKELQKRLNESNFTYIGTNVLYKNGDLIQPFFKIRGNKKEGVPKTYIWKVKNADGKKARIGIFGATVTGNKKDYVYYEDPFKSAKIAYNQLKGKTDFSVGLTHLNIAQDMKLATMVPDVPLIMGGHDHSHMLKHVGKVTIAKADANAKTVYIHRLRLNKKTGKVSLKSELKVIDETIKEDPVTAVLVRKWQHIQDSKIKDIWKNPDEVIYHATEPLDALEKNIRYRQTNFGAMVANAVFAAALAKDKKVDGAVLNSGSIRIDDRLTGDIVALDIFRALPFGGAIYTVEMKGSLLIKILDTGRENSGNGGYLQWANITYNDEMWIINGSPLDTSRNYKIALSDFLLSGHETNMGFLTEKNKGIIAVDKPGKEDTSDLRLDVRKAVIAYMKSRK